MAPALTIDEPPDYRSIRRSADGLAAVVNGPDADRAPLKCNIGVNM